MKLSSICRDFLNFGCKDKQKMPQNRFWEHFYLREGVKARSETEQLKIGGSQPTVNGVKSSRSKYHIVNVYSF